jgi:hypothetical protein
MLPADDGMGCPRCGEWLRPCTCAARELEELAWEHREADLQASDADDLECLD